MTGDFGIGDTRLKYFHLLISERLPFKTVIIMILRNSIIYEQSQITLLCDDGAWCDLWLTHSNWCDAQ